MKRDVMEAHPGEVVMFEGKRHRVVSVDFFTGFLPPYMAVECIGHRCEAAVRPLSHRNFRWPETEPQAREDQPSWPSISVLCKGREQGG